MSHNDFDRSDFYSYESLLTDEERELLHAVREFMTTDVAPLLLEHWSRATFPLEIVPGMRRLGTGLASPSICVDDRVVDERWDPPVTLGVRLVSVISDDLQHVGQAAYLRGLADRR